MEELESLGQMLEHVGKELQDPKSDLRMSCHCSEAQIVGIVQTMRVLTSPALQTVNTYQLAKRWGKTTKTIGNWVRDGVLVHGFTEAGETAMKWYSDDIDREEERLYRLGYLKRRTNPIRSVWDKFNNFISKKNGANI